jgi:hypothetical protein
MGKAKVTIDTSNIDAIFQGLTDKERTRVARNAIRASGRILERETERRFGQVLDFSGSSKRYGRNARYPWKLEDTATVVLARKIASATVHIMKDFRAKFFEGGVKFTIKDKQTRKAVRNAYKYSGWTESKIARTFGLTGYRIDPMYLFRKAQDATERKIFDNLKNEIDKYIIRIYKRNLKKQSQNGA